MEPATEWDVFLVGPGGKGSNQAVGAARLGARTALIGRVGNDQRGRALVASLVEEGIHVVHVNHDPESPTGAAVIQVDVRGRKQILAAPGANRKLTVDDIDASGELIGTTRVLLMQLEVPVECIVAAGRLGKETGARVVLDAAPAAPLPDELFGVVDLIRANAEEAEAITGIKVYDRRSARRAATALVSRGIEAAIVEAGDEGNLLVARVGEEWLPRLPVKPVDATGAGDAFSAALSVALAERLSFEEAGRFASGAAALATTALGAQAGLPRRSELLSYLAQIPA